MNSRFVKYLKLLHTDSAKEESLAKVADELHRTFATLTQEEQKYANLLLHDIQRGDIVPDENKTFRYYITEYLSKAKNTQVHQLVEVLGVDEDKLMKLMVLGVTEADINAFGRFDELKATADKQKAKAYFKRLEELSPGERGILLLIFYLALNKDSKPIIIDQPEDNLDNQSVYSKLVPCICKAKQKRQVIIVTHNPNIAVACDAEQIIYCEKNKCSNHIEYIYLGLLKIQKWASIL